MPVAVTNIVRGDNYHGSSRILQQIPEVIRHDLQLSGYFFVISPRIFKDKSKAVTKDLIPFAKWVSIGARALVKGVANREADQITIQLRLFDTENRQVQVGKQYTFASEDWRMIAHRFSDEIMFALTGVRGPFATKIAYTIQTKKAKKKRWKQIYVSDIDGANLRRMTKDKAYNLGASWSSDGNYIVFTSYVDGFPNIYSVDLRTGRRYQLTANRSTNITPQFSPNGSQIAFSSGQGRDMDIYLMSARGGRQRVFSPAFGIDIAPTFSPNGSELLFSSERGGKLNLYRKRLDGHGKAIRITFAGSQNDSADWSPDGTKIVFTRFTGGKYDIFTVNPDGSNPRQITFYGSNEHPRWSPDSRFITYSSTANHRSQIYVMRFDGANKMQITKGKDASLPDWGPWPADYWR